LAVYNVLEQAKAAGRARALGVSNFNATMLEEFFPRISTKPVVNQAGFSIAGHTKDESRWGRDDATVSKSKQLGIQHMACSPFGQYTDVDVLNDPTVASIAAAHGKTSAQVALRWIVQQDIVVVTRSNSLEHDEEDMDIFNWTLTADEMQRLSAIPSNSTESAFVV